MCGGLLNSGVDPIHTEGMGSKGASPLFSAIAATSPEFANDNLTSIFANGDGEDDVDDLGIAIEVENNDNTKKRRPMIIDQMLPTGEKSSAQVIAEGALIKRLGSIVTTLVNTRNGDIIMPKGLMWDDINLDHPKITQLWDVKQPGALVYYHELSNKGGYSRHPQPRYLLGYKKLETSESKSPIPILANIHNQCASTHRLLTDEITKLFKDYGSKISPFVNAKCQEAIDNEKVSVPFYFTLTCQIMTLLEGVEPRTIREIFMGLVIESGLQDLCDLDQKSAVHEPFTKTSLSRSMKDHAEDATKVNGFLQHAEFSQGEQKLLSELMIYMDASMAWPPRIESIRNCLSDQPWTELPAFKTIVTSAMILGKNTPGDTRIYDIMDKPPQGRDPYDPSAYDDSDIVAGFEGNFLQQVDDFIHSTDAVAFHCFDRFEYMWDVLKRLKYFKDVFVTERWEKIESEFGDKYGNGMNAIKYFIYHGFKPFWNPTDTLTGLVLRPKKGQLRVVLVHHSVSYIGHSGPLTNKDGTPLSSSAALGALINQSERANDPWIITLLNHQLQERNASLNVSTNLGDFPIAGNALVARDLRNYGGLCLHGDKKLATLPMKFVLLGDVDLMRKHRMGFPNGNCEIVSRALRRGEGPSSAHDYWWFIAFVAELAALRNGTKKEAVARAFKCLCRDRTVDGNKQHAHGAIKERYYKLIRGDYKGAFSGEVLQLLQNEWKRYTPDQSVKPTPDQSVKQCARCNVSKRKIGNFNSEESRKDEGICISCETKEEINKSNELQQQRQQQQQQQAKVEKLESLLAMDTQQKKATKSKNASIEKIVSTQNEERSVMNMWKAAKIELQQLRTALKAEEDEEKKSELSIRIDEVKKRKEELMELMAKM